MSNSSAAIGKNFLTSPVFSRNISPDATPSGATSRGLVQSTDININNSMAGTHTGATGAGILEDTTATWTPNALIGFTVYNVTDGSSGVITANTATTITASLSGGTDNDWDDTPDSYKIGYAVDTVSTWNGSGGVTQYTHSVVIGDFTLTLFFWGPTYLNPTEFWFSVSAPDQVGGPVQLNCHLAKTVATVYVCPKILIS